MQTHGGNLAAGLLLKQTHSKMDAYACHNNHLCMHYDACTIVVEHMHTGDLMQMHMCIVTHAYLHIVRHSGHFVIFNLPL